MERPRASTVVGTWHPRPGPAADELAHADGDDHGVDAAVGYGAVYQRLQDIGVADDVVGDQQPAGGQLRDDRFVESRVVLLPASRKQNPMSVMFVTRVRASA